MKRKLAGYARMGIPQIWVVDPDTGVFERCQDGCLTPATDFEHGAIRFHLPEIANFLQA